MDPVLRWLRLDLLHPVVRRDPVFR
jgi:hypothetical protein